MKKMGKPTSVFRSKKNFLIGKWIFLLYAKISCYVEVSDGRTALFHQTTLNVSIALLYTHYSIFTCAFFCSHPRLRQASSCSSDGSFIEFSAVDSPTEINVPPKRKALLNKSFEGDDVVESDNGSDEEDEEEEEDDDWSDADQCEEQPIDDDVLSLFVSVL